MTLDCMENCLWGTSCHMLTCTYYSIVFICHVCNNYLCYILCADRKPHKVNRPQSDSQEFLPENEYAEIPRSMVNPGKH